MKKLTVLSIMAASFLLVGCGDSATGSEAKAAAEHKTESSMKCGEGKCGHAEKAETAKKCGEGKCGGDKKSAATEAKEAAAKAVESVKEKASSAVDSAKAAAASAASAATAAVAAATESGPDGKALYAKCAGCHGADGKTKAMGKAPILAGQSAADLESKLAGYKAGTRNEHGMGMLMKGQVASMSDADIKAIAAYIAGL